MLADARTRLADELDRIGAESVMLSTNLELRADGHPRANSPPPGDPGAALYFTLRGRPVVLACDKWQTVPGNIAAIAAHIDALRGQERWGVGTLEAAFTGYLALPGGTPDWRNVLGYPGTVAEAVAEHRRRMMEAHPDRGGTDADATALNVALDAARRELPP